MHDIDVRNSYVGGESQVRPPEPRPDGARQDREVLLLDAGSVAELRGRIAYLAETIGGLEVTGLADLAAALQQELAGRPVRAAVVAASADQAAERLARLLALLDDGIRAALDVAGGVFLGVAQAAPRVGFLFPGQGSGRGNDGGALALKFETVRDLYQTVTIPAGHDPAATAVAQPRIVTSSVAGLRVLSTLGIEASAAVGHSLGELTALHWAGAMTEPAVVELAGARGQIMATASEGGGAMAGIAAGPGEVAPLLRGEPVVIAGYNGPSQTVVAGPAEAVERVRAAAAAGGVKAARVAVSDAFHSPAMAPAATGLRAYLAGQRFQPLARRVLSTVTGDILPADADLSQLLVAQLCEPVRFSQALGRMADAGLSLLIEVGPGRVLSALAARITPGTPVIPLATDSTSLSGVLSAAAAAYVLGMPVRHDRLFADGQETAPGPRHRPAGPLRPRAPRFVSRTRVHVPGKELIADAELSAASDPYLYDHRPGTEPQFPAVLALEAMAQVAAPLVGADCNPAFEQVEFLRPVVIAADGSVTIRIAAIRDRDSVDVVIRSSSTGFGADHIRATLRYDTARPPGPGLKRPVVHRTRIPLDPATELYGGILDRGRRYQRVLGYRRLAAWSCVAEVSADVGDRWFGSYHADDLLLGDPGIRDAAVHAIQSCVPDMTLRPAAIERLYPARLVSTGEVADDARHVIVYAAERHRADDTYTYDLDVYAAGGQLLERWQGLRMVAVRRNDGGGPWTPALLGPYLERRLADLAPDQPRCVVAPDAGDLESRRRQTAAAVSQLLGRPALVWHRSDGRPEIAEEGLSVCAAHGAGVMFAIVAGGQIGCDASEVQERPAQDWQALLGSGQFALAERIAGELGESRSVAATRVSAAMACLRQSGWPDAAPMTLARSRAAGRVCDGWVLLDSGQAQIATFHTRLRDNPSPVVFSILTKGRTNESVLRVPPRC